MALSHALSMETQKFKWLQPQLWKQAAYRDQDLTKELEDQLHKSEEKSSTK